MANLLCIVMPELGSGAVKKTAEIYGFIARRKCFGRQAKACPGAFVWSLKAIITMAYLSLSVQEIETLLLPAST